MRPMRALQLSVLPLAVATVVGACGGSSNSNGPTQRAANPCATRGATYLVTFVQMSGTCGPLASQVINISPSGTVTSAVPITCASGNQSGCMAQENDCTWTANGFSYTATTDTTFAQDGSSATGLESITATGNGTACASTYDVTFTRQ